MDPCWFQALHAAGEPKPATRKTSQDMLNSRLFRMKPSSCLCTSGRSQGPARVQPLAAFKTLHSGQEAPQLRFACVEARLWHPACN